MDNASKALIIAGAVLIAVMLVSVGVMVYNRATEGIGSALDAMDRTSASGFNASFSAYLDTNLTRRNAVNLLDTIIESNRKNDERKVGFLYVTSAASAKDSNYVSGDLAKMRSNATLPGDPDSNALNVETNYQKYRNTINALTNRQFFAVAHKDYNGYIDNIKLYSYGNK